MHFFFFFISKTFIGLSDFKALQWRNLLYNETTFKAGVNLALHKRTPCSLWLVSCTLGMLASYQSHGWGHGYTVNNTDLSPLSDWCLGLVWRWESSLHFTEIINITVTKAAFGSALYLRPADKYKIHELKEKEQMFPWDIVLCMFS